jgi:hypothetical protein
MGGTGTSEESTVKVSTFAKLLWVLWLACVVMGAVYHLPVTAQLCIAWLSGFTMGITIWWLHLRRLMK